MLRRLLEAYLYAREPGRIADDYEESLIRYGVKNEVAKMAARFCNDFSHARFDSIYGTDLESLNKAPEIIKEVLEELEKNDSEHFLSMQELVKT